MRSEGTRGMISVGPSWASAAGTEMLATSATFSSPFTGTRVGASERGERLSLRGWVVTLSGEALWAGRPFSPPWPAASRAEEPLDRSKRVQD
jgi:hypothetical protein